MSSASIIVPVHVRGAGSTVVFNVYQCVSFSKKVPYVVKSGGGPWR